MFSFYFPIFYKCNLCRAKNMSYDQCLIVISYFYTCNLSRAKIMSSRPQISQHVTILIICIHLGN